MNQWFRSHCVQICNTFGALPCPTHRMRSRVCYSWTTVQNIVQWTTFSVFHNQTYVRFFGTSTIQRNDIPMRNSRQLSQLKQNIQFFIKFEMFTMWWKSYLNPKGIPFCFWFNVFYSHIIFPPFCLINSSECSLPHYLKSQKSHN